MNQNQAAEHIANGDKEAAAKSVNNIKELTDNFVMTGASAKEIQAISDDTDIKVLSAQANYLMAQADTEQGRTAVMKQVIALPDTDVNIGV